MVDVTEAMPRWVKLFAIFALVLALVVAIVVVGGIGGEHGPSRHLPPDATERGR
jgi:hypothetical protein